MFGVALHATILMCHMYQLFLDLKTVKDPFEDYANVECEGR